MKIKDLRKKSGNDLTKEADKLRVAIAKAQMERFTNDEKNFKKSRNLRRDLAQVLTILGETGQNDVNTDETDDKKSPSTKDEGKKD